jgi:LPXTG-motif cell wall-anchored protein
MKCRLLTAASMAAMLLAGPLAATAFGQEGFEAEGDDSCAAAVAALDDSPLVDEVDGDARPSLDDLLAQGLDPDEICTIYGADILPVVEEREPEDEEEIVAVTTVQPTEVLGVTLAETGVNSALLVVLGLGLVGLGVVAVRRPKRSSTSA